MKSIRLVWSALLALLVTLEASAGTPPMMMKDGQRTEAAWAYADSTMKGMSDEQMLAQLIMPMVWPKDDTKSIKEWDKLVKKGYGGVLWQKGTPQVQLKLTNRMRTHAKVPMLVAMDGEWGLSMRLSGTVSWPRNMVLGATNDLLTIFEYGRATANEAKRMGIHVNFAPVADVNNNPDNPVIGTRSFGSNPTQVAKQVLSYAQGLESQGVLSVAKHFPGHGDTSVDSHKALPVISHPRERLDEVELEPFKTYIGNGLGGIMTAHLTVPALDSTRKAASASYAITTSLLQEELGFEGLIFTDGLGMQGIIDASGKKSVGVEVFKAGNDILLAPPSPEKTLSDLHRALDRGEIERSEVIRRCRKVLAWKYLLGANDRREISATNLSTDLNSHKSEQLLDKIYEQGVTLLKNNANALPLRKGNSVALLRYGNTQVSTLVSEIKGKHDTSSYAVANGAPAGVKSNTYAQLRKSGTVIVAVTSDKARPDEGLVKLSEEHEVILVFMTSPYVALHYRDVIAHAKAVVIGYDTKVAAQRAVGKALNGVIACTGVLPVDLPPLFKAGASISTKEIGITYAKSEEVGLNPLVLAEIDKIAEEGISRGAYPGCQVLVGKQGKVVYSKAFGYKDAKKTEPNNVGTLYDLASVTKASVTTPLVMIAEDEGLLKTSDKIGKYLSYLKGSNKEGVRISDLLFHSGGMPAVINFYISLVDHTSYNPPFMVYSRKAGFPIQAARNVWAKEGWRFLPILVQSKMSDEFPIRLAEGYYLSTTVRDMMRTEIRNAPLRRGYRYSDIDFLILQDILEELYNQPLDQIFYEKIAVPLGTSHLVYNPLNRFEQKAIAEGQRDNFLRRQTLRGDVDDEAAAMLGGVSGNAGLFGSAEALFPVVQMLLNRGIYNGTRVVKQETVDKFTKARHGVSPYAMGFDRHRGKGKKGNVAETAPVSTYGHTGFTGTCFWIDPENEMVYIFLSNRTAPTRWNTKLSQLHIRTRIQETIYKALK